jgi:hypothetical protein
MRNPAIPPRVVSILLIESPCALGHSETQSGGLCEAFRGHCLSMGANQLAALWAGNGVHPGEPVSVRAGRWAGSTSGATLIRGRHGLINLDFEIGRLFDQDRRKVRVVG